MPGAVARTSTLALTGTTLNYGLQIADNGLEKAISMSRAISTGVNTYDGSITCKAVAEAHGLPFTPIKELAC
jgi:alanine dehydrogenase